MEVKGCWEKIVLALLRVSLDKSGEAGSTSMHELILKSFFEQNTKDSQS